MNFGLRLKQNFQQCLKMALSVFLPVYITSLCKVLFLGLNQSSLKNNEIVLYIAIWIIHPIFSSNRLITLVYKFVLSLKYGIIRYIPSNNFKTNFSLSVISKWFVYLSYFPVYLYNQGFQKIVLGKRRLKVSIFMKF